MLNECTRKQKTVPPKKNPNSTTTARRHEKTHPLLYHTLLLLSHINSSKKYRVRGHTKVLESKKKIRKTK